MGRGGDYSPLAAGPPRVWLLSAAADTGSISGSHSVSVWRPGVRPGGAADLRARVTSRQTLRPRAPPRRARKNPAQPLAAKTNHLYPSPQPRRPWRGQMRHNRLCAPRCDRCRAHLMTNEHLSGGRARTSERLLLCASCRPALQMFARGRCRWSREESAVWSAGTEAVSCLRFYYFLRRPPSLQFSQNGPRACASDV